MANNLLTGNNGGIGKGTTALSAKLNGTNCAIVQRIGNPIVSWKPTRDINAFDHWEIDKNYLIKMLANVDAEAEIGVNASAFGGGGSSYHADAQAYFDRAAAAPSPYTFTTPEKTAFNNLVLAGISHGWWNKIIDWYIYWGNVAVAKLNVKANTFTQTWFGDMSYTKFAIKGTTTGYIKTGLIPSTHLTLNDYSVFGFWGSSTNEGVEIGTNSGSNRAIYILPKSSGQAFIQAQGSETSPAGVTVSDSSGLWIANRASITDLKIWRTVPGTPGVVQVGASALSDPSTLPTIEMYIAATNNSGTAAAFSSSTHNMDGFAASFTKSQADFFADDYITFLTAATA